MQDIMIRIETDDFAAWKEQHDLHAENLIQVRDHRRPGLPRPRHRWRCPLPHPRRGRGHRHAVVPKRHIQGCIKAGEGYRPTLLPRPAAEQLRLA